jgi:hypothetical protein
MRLDSVQCAESDVTITYDASTLTSSVTFKTSLASTSATIKFQAALTDQLLATVPFAGALCDGSTAPQFLTGC